MSHGALLREVATRASAGELQLESWLGLLPDPDPVLRRRGEYADVLEELTADDQVCVAMQQRKLKTLLRRTWRWRPGGEAEGRTATPGALALAQALQEDLEQIDLYQVTSEVLEAPYYGYTAVEALWRPEASRLRLEDLVPKPRRWFGFNPDNGLVFRPLLQLQGEPVVQHKVVLARHFATYDNPYGLRLLSRCLWPVAFKRGGVQFWVAFCEKYGMPWVVAEGDQDEAGRRQTAGALASMVRDAVAVVSGCKVTVHEFSGSPGNLHENLVGHWNLAISKILMGQTMTADVGAVGSYAAAKTHYDVLGDFSEADSRLVEAFWNEVAWSYGQVNAPGELAPVFEYYDPDDLASQADLDAKLYQVGVRFRKAHFEQRYSLDPEHFDLAPEGGGLGFAAPAGSAQPVPSATPGMSAGQQAADDLADQLLERGAALVRDQAQRLLDLVSRAESYDDALLLLAEALGPEADDQVTQLLLSGLVNAALLGRWAAREEAGTKA